MRLNPIRSIPPFWALQVGGWLAFGAALAIGRIGELRFPTTLIVDGPLVVIGFSVTLAMRYLYSRVRPIEEVPRRAIGVGLAASYLGAVLWTAMYRLYLRGPASALLSIVHGEPVRLGDEPLLDDTVHSAVVLLAWSVVYFGIRSYQALQEERERSLRAEAHAKDAQLRMLAYQLNPHFLFNALNSIRAMIDEDRGRARGMVTELAGFLRYALLDRPLQAARLSEELDVIRGYLAIERIRFEERLDVAVAVAPEAERCWIPAFLLHPLVENALKHGSGLPLRVRVLAAVEGDRLRVTVENTGSLEGRAGRAPPFPAPAGIGGTGIGLRNVRERLQQLLPGDHLVEITERDGWVRVSIEIPAIGSEPRITGEWSRRAGRPASGEEARWVPATS
jgi:signal transduction histidine kinase